MSNSTADCTVQRLHTAPVCSYGVTPFSHGCDSGLGVLKEHPKPERPPWPNRMPSQRWRAQNAGGKVQPCHATASTEVITLVPWEQRRGYDKRRRLSSSPPPLCHSDEVPPLNPIYSPGYQLLPSFSTPLSSSPSFVPLLFQVPHFFD